MSEESKHIQTIPNPFPWILEELPIPSSSEVGFPFLKTYSQSFSISSRPTVHPGVSKVDVHRSHWNQLQGEHTVDGSEILH